MKTPRHINLLRRAVRLRAEGKRNYQLAEKALKQAIKAGATDGEQFFTLLPDETGRRKPQPFILRNNFAKALASGKPIYTAAAVHEWELDKPTKAEGTAKGANDAKGGAK